MAQHDYIISNQSFPNTRSDLNNSLSAVVSNNSGASEPTTTYAYQWWYDSTNDILKMRNADNDAWITIFTFNQTTDTYSLATDVELTLTENLNLTGTATISGDITVNTDALKVDSTNKFVGIGTASPAAELDIQADVPSIKLTDTDGTNQIGLIYENAGNLFLQSQNNTTNGKITLRRHDGTTLDTTITMDSGGGLLLGTTSAGSAVKGDIVVDGNIYLGGTGSANALDDYEEGTWSPTITSGTATFSNVGYIKVGNLVTVRLFVTTFSDTTSGSTLQFDLPFTVKASTGTTTGSAMSRNIITLGDGLSSYVQQNASLLRVYQNNSGGAWALLVHSDLSASSQMYINITYEAN